MWQSHGTWHNYSHTDNDECGNNSEMDFTRNVNITGVQAATALFPPTPSTSSARSWLYDMGLYGLFFASIRLLNPNELQQCFKNGAIRVHPST